MMSLVKSFLFITDVFSDIWYLENKNLDKVYIGNVRYNFRRYLLLSLLAPMAIELIESIHRNLAKGQKIKYAFTEFIVSFLNQEQCIDMPEERKDLQKHVASRKKANSEKKVKFIIFEDSIQICL